MKRNMLSLLAITVMLFFAFGSTSCKKYVDVIRDRIDTIASKSLLSVTQSSALSNNQTITPGTGSWVGSYVIQNNNPSDSVTVDLVDLGVTSSPGNVFTSLSINTYGANLYVANPKSTNAFILSITLAPNDVITVDANIVPDKADTGFVKTSLKVIASWKKNKTKDTLSAQGQNSLLKLPTLTGVTFLNTSSNVPQYIASSNSCVDAVTLSYNFQTTGQASVPISELKFAAIGSQTASSIRIGGMNFPFVNGIAYATNVNIWAWSNLEAYVSYPSVGPGGVPSGTTSQIILTYVKYNNGAIDKVITPNVPSNTMMLVGSKPIISVYQPSSVLMIGLVHAIDITVQADAQGDVSLNSIPIQTYTMGGFVTLGSGTGIVVKDANGQIVNTQSTAFINGVSKITFIQSGGCKIPAGTTAKFKVYIPISNVGPGSSLGTSIVSSSALSWTDNAGQVTTPYTGTTWFYNYPDYFQSVISN